MCHRDTNHGLGQSTNDGAMNDGAKSDEARNSGSWKRRDEELKLGTTREHEDRDEDQGDKIGRNENTGLLCQ